ncbi:MAG: PDZ domain-containing protein, partial [Clostridiales bacterium]|nr:PDZ domain-containing protein [Clostridiales bacterium]
TYTNYFGIQSKSAVSGSGFIVTSDGYIVTNYHVIQKAYQEGYKVSVMLYNGDKYTAKIVGVEDSSDVAVLKIDATGLSAATLGNSDNLQVGETVYAIGNPLGELSFSMTSGMVSALDREITTQDETTGQTITNNMFQIDAAVNEGNSGGPVYNVKGEVIGIVTAKYSSTGVEGLGFAIPINDVADIVNQLITQGYVSGKANLGITVTTVDSTVAQYYNMVEGAYVYSVESGSCSEKAGLKIGDIITAINGKEVKSSTQLVSEKKKYKAGDTITLKIYRDGEYLDIKVTLDEDIPANAVKKNDKPILPTVPKT